MEIVLRSCAISILLTQLNWALDLTSDPQRSFHHAAEFTIKEVIKAKQVHRDFSIQSFQEIENAIINACNIYYKKSRQRFKHLNQYKLPVYFFESISYLRSKTSQKFPLLHAFGNSKTYWQGQMTLHTMYQGMKHHDLSQGCEDPTTIGSLLYTQMDGKAVHVEWIDIVQAYRGQKLAKGMVKNFISFITHKTLFSIITANCLNERSHALFKSCGFIEVPDAYFRRNYNRYFLIQRDVK